MRVITATNVNEALYIGTVMMTEAEKHVEPVAPRGARTIEHVEPVATNYLEPWNRVLFSPARDANPFFHLMEAMWILAGRKDVSWLAKFNARIADYSDNGVDFHAAYGYRLRTQQGFDQVATVIDLLKSDPDTRRAVLQIWDAKLDLIQAPSDFTPVDHYTKQLAHKDIPCNDLVCFKIRNNRLRMTVYNRSNDMIWGAYGANAVQFAFLQEYIAAHVGCEIGDYTQVSDSFHIYLDDAGGAVWNKVKTSTDLMTSDLYDQGLVEYMPMITGSPQQWDLELQDFMKHGAMIAYSEPWFENVLKPALLAWGEYKAGNRDEAMFHCLNIGAQDWHAACRHWLERRSWT